MIEILEQFVPQLTQKEKIELLIRIKTAIYEKTVGCATRNIKSCPRCECESFVKRGRDGRGKQRYLCRGCRQAFTARSRSVLACLKLPVDVWYAYAECMVDMLALKEAAKRCVSAKYFLNIWDCGGNPGPTLPMR